MIDYHQFCQLKTGAQQGLSISQLARETGVQRSTVRKWLSRHRFEQSAGGKQVRPSKLDAHRDTIRRLLAAHEYTARQLYQRLKDEGYEGSYTILKRFVASVRPRPRSRRTTLRK